MIYNIGDIFLVMLQTFIDLYYIHQVVAITVNFQRF